MWQKRRTYIVCHEWQHLSHTMTRETYMCNKRDLHIWQERPAYVTKETHIHRLSRMATSLPHTPGLILWRPRAKTWKRSCEMAQNRRSCRSLLSWHMQVSCAISHSFVMAYVGLLCHFKSVLSLMQVSFVMAYVGLLCHFTLFCHGICWSLVPFQVCFVAHAGLFCVPFHKTFLNLVKWHKRPTYAVTKETCMSDETDSHIWQKRPA